MNAFYCEGSSSDTSPNLREIDSSKLKLKKKKKNLDSLKNSALGEESK